MSAPLLEVKSPPGSPEAAETEHFLFYRGVGHVDSPLRLQSGAEEVRVWPQKDLSGLGFGSAWLTEIHADGSCAFRSIDKLSDEQSSERRPASLADLDGKFARSDFSTANLAKLKASMLAALVKEGLYPDEASAMLRTWELSYFKSPGVRFFYMVPRKWVDQVLPLKITGASTEITRVMVGRIELITDSQRAALARLAAGPCPDLPALRKAARQALQNSQLPKSVASEFYRGEKPLSELGIPIPPLVQDYLSLGRFRDALVLRSEHQHPSPALAQLIRDNQIGPQAN